MAATVAHTSKSEVPLTEANTFEKPAAAVEPSPSSIDKSQRLERIATRLFSPKQVFKLLEARARCRRPRLTEETSYVAPRTKLEASLAELWADLLRLESVGIKDNFFDLGGTSLRAVDLFAQIAHRFDKKLPLTSLIEAPTVEELADLVAGDADRNSLVRIRDGGDKPPLFLVHDGDGETMLYRNLALLLKPDHAVFGLQPCSRENAPIVHTRITEMAAYHIERIRSVQPQGPYLVGGMCAGGVIAFEIARQLQKAGQMVALVALIDAADVAVPLKTWRFASQRIRSFSTVFHQKEPIRFDRRVLLAFTKALRKAKNLTTYLVGHRLQVFRDEIRMRLFRFYLDRGRPLPHVLERIPVRTVYLFAEKNYQPAGPFDGDLVLFKATSGEGSDEPYVERYDDPLLGWGTRATRRVRAFSVPGGHSSMLQEPNVSILAEQMQAVIDDTLAAKSTHPLDSALTSLSGHSFKAIPTTC